MRVVLGIGNPGARYEGTHHNLGFDVVRLLARMLQRPFEIGRDPVHGALLSERATGERGGEPFALICPLTFVNRSGQALAFGAGETPPDPGRVLVVCDDLSLPPGRLRLRRRGSDGGHKGLRSVAEALGTTAYPRLRIGIGGAPSGDPVEHVLSRPPAEWVVPLQKAIALAAEGVLDWLDSTPLEELMARLNSPRPETDPDRLE